MWTFFEFFFIYAHSGCEGSLIWRILRDAFSIFGEVHSAYSLVLYLEKACREDPLEKPVEGLPVKAVEGLPEKSEKTRRRPRNLKKMKSTSASVAETTVTFQKISSKDSKRLWYGTSF